MPNRKPITPYDNLKVAHNAPNIVITGCWKDARDATFCPAAERTSQKVP